MEKDKALREYFYARVNQMTEEWHNSIEDNDPESVYASTYPDVIRNLKEQNNDFHKYVCNIFIEEESSFFERFNDWILRIAKDSNHVATPIHYILREFMRVREQYLKHVTKFVNEYEIEISREQENKWNRLVNRVFDITITKFVEEYFKNSKELLAAQQNMINELSSPVISLKNQTALLPLVGDIDTNRAKVVLENTLHQCSTKGVKHLFIDLSGVAMVDTMVANEIFQLIAALNLIGVGSTLSGIRPEIAVTAMQLGLSFENISITSTLSQAIILNEKNDQF